MRHKPIAISLTLVCCLAVALAAQAPSSGAKSQGKEISLTGCLQEGTEPNTFILKNVTAQTAAGSETKPGELAKTDTEYRLTADATVNLKDHVGHKVEVTGATQKQGKSGGGISQFKVKSLKHISPNCP